jgi:hypothetical protein
VVVRLDKLAGFASAFHPGSNDRLLDGVFGKLHLYGVVAAACDPGVIEDDLTSRLARAIHEHYVLARRRRGDTRTNSAALAGWDRLPATARRANRAQAEDIGRKLRAINCVLAPRTEEPATCALSETEVDRLARMEHSRWADERRRAGWRFGERRDDGRLHHPDLREWRTISEVSRQRSRDAIGELPPILAGAGFQIVRV